MSEQVEGIAFLQRLLANLEAGVVDLPAFPQVVLRVQEVLKNPNYSIQMITRPIAADPTLAARLLNMANSTAFNATGRVIIDLGIALTRLGAQKVYSVVLAHAIQNMRRDESLRCVARSLEDAWSQSVAVAHFCDALVKRLKLVMPDAFVAGLLHRVGYFYILVQVARQEAAHAPVSLSRNLMESWHPAFGKAVLKNWRINDAVCDAVGSQADVRLVSAEPTLTDVLVAGMRLANRMLNASDTGNLGAGGVLARLNLTVEDCARLITDAGAEVRTLARTLHA